VQGQGLDPNMLWAQYLENGRYERSVRNDINVDKLRYVDGDDWQRTDKAFQMMKTATENEERQTIVVRRRATEM